MSIYDALVKARNTARVAKKDKDLSVLSVIIGEIQRANIAVAVEGTKEYPDEAVITKVLKPLYKNWSESGSEPRGVEILKVYIPSQLTEDQLKAILKSYRFGGIGDFMKHLKANYPGLYDGKQATEIFNRGK